MIRRGRGLHGVKPRQWLRAGHANIRCYRVVPVASWKGAPPSPGRSLATSAKQYGPEGGRGTPASSPGPSDLRVAQPGTGPLEPSSGSEIHGIQTADTLPSSSNVASSSSSSPPPPPPPKPRRNLVRRSLLPLTFLLVGIALGSSVRLLLDPPPPPPAGSPADAALASQIQAQASLLPLVQELTASPDWTTWQAYASLPTTPPTLRSARLTTGPLGAASGLGAYQQLFHHAATNAITNVLYLGPATTGWPAVVHGGVVATVLDETCGRVAVREFPAGTGVTARLRVDYRRMAFANGFHVVRARAVPDEDLPVAERGKRDRKVRVRATLEDLKGRQCASAEALFVVPKEARGLARIAEQF